MSNEQVAPETKGVTVKLLATVDLGPEIEGMVDDQDRVENEFFNLCEEDPAVSAVMKQMGQRARL